MLTSNQQPDDGPCPAAYMCNAPTRTMRRIPRKTMIRSAPKTCAVGTKIAVNDLLHGIIQCHI